MKPKSSEVGHGYYLLVNKTLSWPQRGPGRYFGENKPNRACCSSNLAGIHSRYCSQEQECDLFIRVFTDRHTKKTEQSAQVRAASALRLAAEARSSLKHPTPCSFFPGSKLTPYVLEHWNTSSLSVCIHTHTHIQTISQPQGNQCKHTPSSEDVPIQARQWGCLFGVNHAKKILRGSHLMGRPQPV